MTSGVRMRGHMTSGVRMRDHMTSGVRMRGHMTSGVRMRAHMRSLHESERAYHSWCENNFSKRAYNMWV